jgi:hypothetical protein
LIPIRESSPVDATQNSINLLDKNDFHSSQSIRISLELSWLNRVYFFVMNTSPRFLALLVMLPFSSSAVFAQAVVPSPPPERPTVDVSGPSQRLSRSTIQAVAAGITYAPPKPVEKKPEPEEVEPDQPKNGIVRLPEYIVHGDRPPVFRPKDVNTKKGLGQIAVDKYFTETGKALNRFTIPLFGMSKEQYALMMWEEEERLKNMQNASENVYLLRQTDPAGAAQLKREVDQTFIRRSEFSPISNGRDK